MYNEQMENTNAAKEVAGGDHKDDAAAKLQQLQKDAAELAAKEQKLKEEIEQAQKEIHSAKEAETKPISKIHHGIEQLPQDSRKTDEQSVLNTERKIIVQLSDCKVPAIPYDLSRPYERREFTSDEIHKYLDSVSDGHITSRLVETDKAGANEMITLLEEARARLRTKFAAYVELPTNALVGLPTDELERKLFMRHFRNKEAQHRVFMIGFSVALFCVIGAVLADAMNEGNQQIVQVAAIIGAATTALGIAGHLTMRIGDGSSEKHAVRMIQELSLLDSVLDRFRLALR
jgi:outer membrane murein-binding lipoprotein Lpp